eukprot:5282040-Prymnesium_polylepis.2
MFMQSGGHKGRRKSPIMPLATLWKNSTQQVIRESKRSAEVAPEPGAGCSRTRTSPDDPLDDVPPDGSAARKVTKQAMRKTRSMSAFEDLGTDNSSQTSRLNRKEMWEDVRRLDERLRRTNRWLLNPRAKAMQYWDFVTLGALFFTATVTPYEVCMMWADTKVDPLFIINYFVNSIFLIDMCFNFLLPYRASIKQGGDMIKSHRRIARNYLKSWFLLDFISILPFDILVVAGVINTEAVNPSMLRMVRMIRLMRLLKLACAAAALQRDGGAHAAGQGARWSPAGRGCSLVACEAASSQVPARAFPRCSHTHGCCGRASLSPSGAS